MEKIFPQILAENLQKMKNPPGMARRVRRVKAGF